MIVTNGSGRLGNNLFQYFFSKILAIEIGTDFRTNFILPNVFGIEDKFNVENFTSPNRLYESWNLSNCKLYLNDFSIKQNLTDIIDIYNRINIKSLQIDGYFQQIEYYSPHFDMIKKSFNYPKEDKKNVLGLHLRKDDITNTINDLPDNWFLKMSKLFPNHKKYITTDSPNHYLVKKLQDSDFELYIDSPENTIIKFSQFSDLILSQGTFSWWMGFLSNGIKHCMVPETGWNSKNSPTNILINDNNWIYYSLDKIK